MPFRTSEVCVIHDLKGVCTGNIEQAISTHVPIIILPHGMTVGIIVIHHGINGQIIPPTH